ncbi:MAG: helix-turn-helix domain-containing protein [Myxococcota bacterium]
MNDEPPDRALVRYQVISAYLALEPLRGQRRAVLDQLAARTWTGADGAPFQVSAETIRVWVRRYRKSGLSGLRDRPRPVRGIQALTPEVIELVCSLKREVPERSLDRLLRILEDMGKVDPGAVRRSTLHRALQKAGLSARRIRVVDAHDLDRFEAIGPNDLWQSDMLAGPWLPDPEVPGKMRRAYLYAFLDDHSRLLLHGRFSFKGDLPALELVFRRSLQKYGVPRKVYYDNGATYRSGHMRQIVAELGIHSILFTTAYRPMGHGKIEAYNRYCTSAFIAEVKASAIQTLDGLNEAFLAWADREYNGKVHGETGETPTARWRAGIGRVRYAEEEAVRRAFQWKETRKADKSGLFSLFGVRFQVGVTLARRSVEIRYDPEQVQEIEVWSEGAFVERLRPFAVQPHRRPKTEPAAAPPAKPVADWLSHLVEKRRAEGATEPGPREVVDEAKARRAAQDDAIVALLADRLDPAVRDDASVGRFLERYGPIDLAVATASVDQQITARGRDLHVRRYLDAIRRAGGR